MEKTLLAIAQAYVRAINQPGSLLKWVKKVICGGFENHKIGASDLPAIQIIYRGSSVESFDVGCTKMRANFEIHLVYNFSSFTNEGKVTENIQKIDTSLLISDQIEKRTDCKYDPTSVCGVVLNNQALTFDEWEDTEERVGYAFTVDSITYGTYQRGAGASYPTGEAIVQTSLFFKT